MHQMGLKDSTGVIIYCSMEFISFVLVFILLCFDHCDSKGRLLTGATIGLVIAGGAYASTVDEATFWHLLISEYQFNSLYLI